MVSSASATYLTCASDEETPERQYRDPHSGDQNSAAGFRICELHALIPPIEGDCFAARASAQGRTRERRSARTTPLNVVQPLQPFGDEVTKTL
jgi:hypothetical protein